VSQLWDDWPRIVFNGQLYAVAPRYIGGVGIKEAHDLATNHGCILPTVALVKAIYSAADCKLDARKFVRSHDGTYRTMASPAILQAQDDKVADAIEAWGAEHGRARLVAGTHKDVIYDTRAPTRGFALGLYGWQKADGTVIQPAFYGHSGAWKDYSQGCRLVKVL